MLIADEYIGSIEEPEVAARVEAASPLRVVLDDTDRRRSRVRTRATDGTELGIVTGRDLEDGDVLLADDRPVVVDLDGVPAVALGFEGVGPDALPAAVALGHAVGNRHRDLAVRDGRVLVRAERDPERLTALLADAVPTGVSHERTTVSPSVFDDGPAPAEHTHAHDHAHQHADARAHADLASRGRNPEERRGEEP